MFPRDRVLFCLYGCFYMPTPMHDLLSSPYRTARRGPYHRRQRGDCRRRRPRRRPRQPPPATPPDQPGPPTRRLISPRRLSSQESAPVQELSYPRTGRRTITCLSTRCSVIRLYQITPGPCFPSFFLYTAARCIPLIKRRCRNHLSLHPGLSKQERRQRGKPVRSDWF